MTENALEHIEGDTLYYHIVFRTDITSYIRFLVISNKKIEPVTFDVINSLRNMDVDNIGGKYVVMLCTPTQSELNRKLDVIAARVSKIAKKNIVAQELSL